MNSRISLPGATFGSAAIALAALVPLGLVASAGTGCSLFGDSIEVAIVLPAVPASWEPIFRAEGGPSFLVRAPGKGRLLQELLVAAPHSGQAAVRLTLPKRANLPVLAAPLVEGRSDLLRPAGALFPEAFSGGGRLALSWEEGFVAALLLKMDERGQLVEALNARRLSEEIGRRCGGDRWSLDQEAILTLLSLGSFRADRIKALPAHSVVLHCAPGSWWVEGDPFRQPVQADALGRLAVDSVVAGFHSFFRVDSPAPDGASAALERLDVSVGAEEWLACNSLTGAAESGRW